MISIHEIVFFRVQAEKNDLLILHEPSTRKGMSRRWMFDHSRKNRSYIWCLQTDCQHLILDNHCLFLMCVSLCLKHERFSCWAIDTQSSNSHTLPSLLLHLMTWSWTFLFCFPYPFLAQILTPKPVDVCTTACRWLSVSLGCVFRVFMRRQSKPSATLLFTILVEFLSDVSFLSSLSLFFLHAGCRK